MKSKWIFENFGYTETGDLENLIAEEAGKGWNFTGWFLNALKFEETKPEKKKNKAEIFLKNAENDFGMTTDSKEFAEYCNAAGWKYIRSKRKFQIFERKDDKAEPIFDDAERISYARKASKISGMYSILILIVIEFWIFSMIYGRNVSWNLDELGICAIIIGLVCLVYNISRIMDARKILKMNTKAYEKEEDIRFANPDRERKRVAFKAFEVFFVMSCFITALDMVVGTSAELKFKIGFAVVCSITLAMTFYYRFIRKKPLFYVGVIAIMVMIFAGAFHDNSMVIGKHGNVINGSETANIISYEEIYKAGLLQEDKYDVALDYRKGIFSNFKYIYFDSAEESLYIKEYSSMFPLWIKTNISRDYKAVKGIKSKNGIKVYKNSEGNRYILLSHGKMLDISKYSDINNFKITRQQLTSLLPVIERYL
jgi:hypothetical protein